MRDQSRSDSNHNMNCPCTKYMYDNFSFDTLDIHVSVYRRTSTIQLGKFLYNRVKVQRNSRVSSGHFEKSGKIGVFRKQGGGASCIIISVCYGHLEGLGGMLPHDI